MTYSSIRLILFAPSHLLVLFLRFLYFLFSRDLSQILLGLTREFDIERFLAVLVGSLVDHRCEPAYWFYSCWLIDILHCLVHEN